MLLRNDRKNHVQNVAEGTFHPEFVRCFNSVLHYPSSSHPKSSTYIYIPLSILHSHTQVQFPPSLDKTQGDGKIRQNLSPPQQSLHWICSNLCFFHQKMKTCLLSPLRNKKFRCSWFPKQENTVFWVRSIWKLSALVDISVELPYSVPNLFIHS